MEKAAQLQNQIRHNSTELNDFLKDLTRWEENVKDEDKNLKTARKFEEKIPPVRSKIKRPKVVPTTEKKKDTEKAEKAKGTSQRISSYDYDAWSKFDADAACKSDSGEESDNVDSEEEAEEDVEEIEQIQHEKSLQKSLMEKEKGNQLFKEGKYEAAINRYTSAIGCDPSNPVLYANRGMALIKTEKYASAEQDCNVALQLDPSYGKAVARRGTARKKLKRYKEALEDFTHLLKAEPKNQQAIQEMKDIKKLLRTTKETNLKDANKSKPVPGIESKNIQPTRRRSNKPLRRMQITEVGLDEPCNAKNEGGNPKNDSRVPEVVHELSQMNGSSVLNVPTSSFMFETEFKRVKNDGEKLYSYLKIIPLTDYGKLFYQCIDNLISPFINTIKYYFIRDNIAYHLELDTLSTIKRFDMAIMFLSRKDKEELAFVINHLSSELYKHYVEEEFIKALARKYSVKFSPNVHIK